MLFLGNDKRSFVLKGNYIINKFTKYFYLLLYHWTGHIIFFTGGLVIRPYFWLFIRPLFFWGVRSGCLWDLPFFKVPNWSPVKLWIKFCGNFFIIKSYGFEQGVSDLNAVLPEMWRQYVEGLLKSFGDHFSSAVGIGSKKFIYLLKLY